MCNCSAVMQYIHGIYAVTITNKETNWTICINCKGCNNPHHFYFNCPVIQEFWKDIKPTLVTLLENTYTPSTFQIAPNCPSQSDLLNLGTSLLRSTPNQDSSPRQPLVASMAFCFHPITKSWHQSMNSGLLSLSHRPYGVLPLSEYLGSIPR